MTSATSAEHPGDLQPLVREGLAVAGNAAALGMVAAGRLAHLARLPMEVAGLLPLAQSQPRLRRAVETAIGPGPADAVLTTGNAVVQALAQGPVGLTIDLGHRLTALGELAARHAVWDQWADRIPPHSATDAEARPAPFPPGRVEAHTDRAAIASAAALAATTLATGSVRRGMATMLAATPKAATAGREAFAAHFGWTLARAGVLCLDRSVLRRLDRIDTLVVDGRLDAPDAPALVRAAREAGLRVVVAADDRETATRAGADESDESGECDEWMDARQDVAAGIRRLQADGAAVVAVTHDRRGLLAADCGVGLGDEGACWEADLVCPDPQRAWLVVVAVGVAQEVSRESAALAVGASTVGATLSVVSPPARAARHAVGAVNAGAALAMADGLRAAALLGRRRPPPGTPPPWHELDADEVLAGLGSTADGLTDEVAAGRRPVRSRADEPISLPAAIAEELANPTTPVLAGAAALSAAAGSLADAGLVATVVAANGTLGGLQRRRVEGAVRDLEQVHDARVSVRRGGRWSSRPAPELVVGDVVRLEAGDAVPADCRILTARALEVEQSAITGEPVPVPKGRAAIGARSLAERSSMVYEGSAIAAGRARAVVVAVAPDTELRRATDGVAPPATGVENRMRDLTRFTIPVSVAGGGVLLGSSLARGLGLREGLAGGVSLAVAAVPEGLPLLATMAQLAAARRLSGRGALVRNPRALEALGRTEVLCCDKTGTLTQGRIALHAVHDGSRLRRLDRLGAYQRAVLAAACRASPDARSDGTALPHPTDQAVVEGASRRGIGPDDGLDRWEKVAELPFEPARGYHAVLARTRRGHLLSVKGAPEVVLPRCRRWRHGEARTLGERDRQRLARTVDRMGGRGYRLLAVAERRTTGRAFGRTAGRTAGRAAGPVGAQAPSGSEHADLDDLDDDRIGGLDLLGFVVLVDPVRPTGAASVASLQAAGISVVMLTGDHRSTAQGVAVELGVLNGRRTLTGADLDQLSDEELDAVLDHVGVFARVTPSHKTRLVAAYQRRGQAVAMTGDGANDAPAIRLADAGIALGPRATPAARAAADLVVPDGRIETLVDAIVEGRALWTSVRDAIAILVGGNLGEIAFTVLGSAGSGRPPLNPRQLLLVNLLTDIGPAIAVATRPPDIPAAQLLAEGPEMSLGRPLEQAIAARALSTTVGATAAWTGGRLTGRPARARTIALVGLVGAQLGQTLRAGARDPAVLTASVGSAAALAAVVQTPGLSHFFGCVPLGPVAWTIGLASAAAATVTATTTTARDVAERLVSWIPVVG